MAVLDRYVEEMSKHHADALIFASNKLVEMRLRGEVRSITAQPVSADQLTRVMQETIGADFAHRLADGLGVFTHQTPTGTVSITVVRNHQGMTVTVEPAGVLVRPSPTPPSVSSRPSAPVSRPSEAMSRPLTPPFVPSVPPGPRSVPEPSARGTGPHARIDPGGALPRNIEALFTHMIEMNASDLHLQTGKAPVVRVDGNLVRMKGWGRLPADVLTELIRAIAPERNLKEFEKYGDTDWAYETEGARIRCNVFRDRLGLAACFRQIPWKIRTAKELNLPPAVIDFCDLHKGFVVVAGPTGSGKSTTLAAMIDHINETQDTHIITVEDPIEFVHPEKRSHINQREVGPQTRNFKTALRAALREDPDIVLVGEMRDLETVAIAIETAETGHLVFGTLHTNTAASTIDRIINQFPADRQPQIRAMLADSLRGVVSQTLVKRKNGGRVAAMEILLVTHAVSNLIREGKTYHIGGIMQTSRNLGMQTQSDALFDLVKSGIVDAKEAYEHAVDKKEFGFLLTKAGIKGNWETL